MKDGLQAVRAALVGLIMVAPMLGCAPMPADPPSLYERLGGAAKVSTVVDRLIDRCAQDSRTQRSFDGVKLAPLKESVAQQICAVSAGGCRYEGETMERAHRDAKIGASEFDAMVTILREELDRAGVDAQAKNELLRLLAPMKRDIVNGSHGATEQRS